MDFKFLRKPKPTRAEIIQKKLLANRAEVKTIEAEVNSRIKRAQAICQENVDLARELVSLVEKLIGQPDPPSSSRKTR